MESWGSPHHFAVCKESRISWQKHLWQGKQQLWFGLLQTCVSGAHTVSQRWEGGFPHNTISEYDISKQKAMKIYILFKETSVFQNEIQCAAKLFAFLGSPQLKRIGNTSFQSLTFCSLLKYSILLKYVKWIKTTNFSSSWQTTVKN